ncbi:hypothetical protein EV382_2757 [Micromonospora violae]|uniref:Uncharacterized protein n=1 Tax=Micromonospora violae TaxID=1278207 RepID=A0A4Q7UJ24_9ACTN|nr:hypothetical protein [Micromonospora violae]RZT79543.1 hypothetical protein EV382_2757 [Micromonospora violae]
MQQRHSASSAAEVASAAALVASIALVQGITEGPSQAAVSCSGTVSWSYQFPVNNPVIEMVIYYNSTNGGTNSACLYHRGAAYGKAARTDQLVAFLAAPHTDPRFTRRFDKLAVLLNGARGWDHRGHDRKNRVLRPPVSVTTEPELLGPQVTLFEHALRLHQQHPDGALPRNGEPYPDHGRHRSRPSTRRARDRRLHGADVAVILDKHFSQPDAQASELVDGFRDVYVPIHRNDHIVAAALRADRQRMRQTGRWLVRRSNDRNAATVGLALLAADWAEDDIPLIQTIGLLSDHFGPLAAEALQRRRGGAEALQWLAERVAGWGRVYVVEALCRLGAANTRAWLLRHACDGDYLNGYFAGTVATTAHLSEAITSTDVDDELIDHTGRLLRIMADCGGMGVTLEHYPPAPVVLAAHSAHLAQQSPTADRYMDAAVIANYLVAKPPNRCGCTAEQRDRVVQRYLAVLDRPDWRNVVRVGLGPTSDFLAWFTDHIAARLRLSDAFRPG